MTELIRKEDALTILLRGKRASTDIIEAIAALPAVTVGVKPLVWAKTTHYSTDDDGGPMEGIRMALAAWEADGYLIIQQRNNGLYLLRGNSLCVGLATATLDAAKAAAQAAYEARILAALEPVAASDPAAIREADWQNQRRVDAMRRRHMNAPEDPHISVLCERYGYGAVMDAASRLWARKDSMGAFYVGGCIGLKSDDEADALIPTKATADPAVNAPDYILAPHFQRIVEGAKNAPQWDTVSDRMAATDPTEYERKVAQMKEDFPNGI